MSQFKAWSGPGRTSYLQFRRAAGPALSMGRRGKCRGARLLSTPDYLRDRRVSASHPSRRRFQVVLPPPAPRPVGLTQGQGCPSRPHRWDDHHPHSRARHRLGLLPERAPPLRRPDRLCGWKPSDRRRRDGRFPRA